MCIIKNTKLNAFITSLKIIKSIRRKYERKESFIILSRESLLKQEPTL